MKPPLGGMDMCTVICYWYVGSKQPLVPTLKFAKAVDFPPQDVKKERYYVYDEEIN